MAGGPRFWCAEIDADAKRADIARSSFGGRQLRKISSIDYTAPRVAGCGTAVTEFASSRADRPLHRHSASFSRPQHDVRSYDTGGIEQENWRNSFGRIGIPGAVSSKTGLIKNANSTWLNGRPLRSAISRPCSAADALANDANCFALSEATDWRGSRHRYRIRGHSRHPASGAHRHQGTDPRRRQRDRGRMGT